MNKPIKLNNLDDVFHAPDLSNVKRVAGFKAVKTLFVDNSGMGQTGEAALTADQFIDATKQLMQNNPDLYAGLTGIGQFQVFITFYEKSQKKGKK